MSRRFKDFVKNGYRLSDDFDEYIPSDNEEENLSDYEDIKEEYSEIECYLIEAFTFLDFGENGLSKIIDCLEEINKIYHKIKIDEILKLKELVGIIEKMDSIAIKNEEFQKFLKELKKKLYSIW